MKTIEQQIITFVEELQKMIDNGMSLKQISKETYLRRESGENIPYMSVLNSCAGEIITLAASPTSKQKALKEWFKQPRQGSKILTRELFIEVVNGEKPIIKLYF